MTDESVKAYWQKFLSTLPLDSPYGSNTYVAEGWGDSPAMADELGTLILQGIKTATCSALWDQEGNPILQTGLIRIALKKGNFQKMILYKKDFLLGKGITFSSYLKALEKKRFPKYYLRIEKIPSTTDYRATITFTVPTWQWSLRGAFIDGVLLRECRIRYLEGEKHFTIQASARTPNLILASFMVIGAIFLFILELFMITTNKSASFNNISILTTVMILMLIPSTWIYLQDKNFLDRVGSLGTELEKS